MGLSQLQIFSYGVAASNKELSSHDLEITPMEQASLVNGELTQAATEDTVSGKDADGASFEASTNTSATVTARWLPFSSNRKTPPDIRRGEKVAIWRFGDADKYYWSELEYEAKLRKLETVVYSYSNTQVEDEEATSETTYYFEISTHTKVIKVHTSQSDGEPFGYDIVLNTKDGNFTIMDTIENYFRLDSQEHQLILSNADKSYFEINKEDINLYAIRDFNIFAGRNMTMRIISNFLSNIGENSSTKIGGNRIQEVGGNISYSAPKNIDFTTPSLNTSKVLTTGSNALIGGGISTGNAAGESGQAVINGPIRIVGEVQLDSFLHSDSGASFAGSVDAPNIN